MSSTGYITSGCLMPLLIYRQEVLWTVLWIRICLQGKALKLQKLLIRVLAAFLAPLGILAEGAPMGKQSPSLERGEYLGFQLLPASRQPLLLPGA